MDPASIDFKANMDALNNFMRDRGLPKTLKVALRTFFHNSRKLQQVQSESHLVAMMSPLMQSTVALQANKDWLDRIWYLRSEWYYGGDSETVHSAFVACLAQKMIAQGLIAQERVAGGLLCIVNRGLAIKRWRFMSVGKVGAACSRYPQQRTRPHIPPSAPHTHPPSSHPPSSHPPSHPPTFPPTL